MAANLLALGRNVELERRADGSLECVEVIEGFSPETKAAIEESDLTTVPDFRTWLDAVG